MKLLRETIQEKNDMKLLREAIRRLMLEAVNTSKYENLAHMLSVGDFQYVQQAIELIISAPDSNAGGEEYAELISHTIQKGNSPSSQLQSSRRHGTLPGSTKGSPDMEDNCFHVFELKLNQPFLEYMKQQEPSSSISLQNFAEPTMIFAEDEGEKWSDVCDDCDDNSVTEIEIPI